MSGPGHREHGHERVPQRGQRELREVEGRCLTKIGNCLFDGLTLSGGSSFWIQGHKATFFSVGKDGCEFHFLTPVLLPRLSLWLPHGADLPLTPNV